MSQAERQQCLGKGSIGSREDPEHAHILREKVGRWRKGKATGESRDGQQDAILKQIGDETQNLLPCGAMQLLGENPGKD